MHVSMYDSNPQEWGHSTIKPKSKEMAAVAFDIICNDNVRLGDGPRSGPIGPKKLIERDGHTVVVASVQGGYEAEPILYVLSAEKVEDDVLDALVKEFCPADEEFDEDDEEEFDDE